MSLSGEQHPKKKKSFCRIKDVGYAALTSALKSNPSSHLRELNLGYNKAGDLGVKKLSVLLKNPHCTLEKLRLSMCSITDIGCAALASALISNPSSHLRELNLSDNKAGDSGVKELSVLLKNPHCTLETLELCNCSTTDVCCAALASALISNPSSHLRELNLSYNEAGDSGVKQLSVLLKDPHCTLEKLELSVCRITDVGCAALASALISNPSSHLRELDLSYNKAGDSGVKQLSVLLENPHCTMEKLELSDCSITDVGCAALASALISNPSSHLRELDLSYNEAGDSGVKELSVLLENPHCTLEKLQLSMCSITDVGCAALASALISNPSSHLRELNLSYNKVQASGVKQLSVLLENPHCTLEKLELSYCSITDVGCAALASALISNPSSHLRELNLSYNEAGDSGVKQLSVLLENPHCTLETVNLCNCRITDVGCAALASTLISNPSSHLRELNLSYNKAGDSGVKQLSVLLKNPLCTLEKLHLCNCRITDSGCAALASALISNPSSHLRELNLSYNKVRDSGVKQLSVLLENPHCTLEKLQLCNCRITDVGCAALESALISNPSSHLRELNLSDNKAGGSVVKQLSVLLENPHCTLKTPQQLPVHSSSGGNIDERKLCTSPSSPTRPVTTDYPGVHGFKLHFQQSSTDESVICTYSPELSKLYCQLAKPCALDIEVDSSPPAGAVLRATTDYKGPEHAAEGMPENSNVCVELVHLQCDKDTSQQVYWDKDKKLSHSITVPYEPPQADSKYTTVLFQYMCNSSCEGRLNHQPIWTIITLETQEGQVLGRCSFKVSVCVYPEQDRNTEEANYKKQLEEKTIYSPLRTCKACLTVQDSTNWVAIKPLVFKEDDHLKYRTIVSSGCYECTVTGLCWESSCNVELEYWLCDLKTVNEFLQKEQFQLCGPLMDMTVISGKLDAVYLPHFLCLGSESSLHDEVRVLHVEDAGISLEKCELTRFHAKLLKPTFSPRAVLVRNGFPVKAHCEVLIYKLCSPPLTLHVYVIPSLSEIKEIVKNKEHDKSLQILKPNPECSLQMKSWYIMNTVDNTLTNCNSEITPQRLKLRYTDVPNFFEVHMKNPEKDFNLQLIAETNKELVWQAKMRVGYDFRRCDGERDVAISYANWFVDKHMNTLIQRVSLVNPVADDLKSLIGDEKYSIIQATQTSQEQMRKLYDFLSGGQELKYCFYQSLLNNEPYLVAELAKAL